MPEPSTDFVYPDEPEDVEETNARTLCASGSDQTKTLSAAAELFHRVIDFACLDEFGNQRSAHKIHQRLTVIAMEMFPRTENSYRTEAERLDCSPARLCQLASEFRKQFPGYQTLRGKKKPLRRPNQSGKETLTNE